MKPAGKLSLIRADWLLTAPVLAGVLRTATALAAAHAPADAAKQPELSLPEGAAVPRDLAYVPGGHECHKLDLYLPEDGTNLPLIVNIHGDADPMVPHHQSALLEAALKKTDVQVTFYSVKGAGHGGFTDPKVPEMTREFLARHLKPAKPNP